MWIIAGYVEVDPGQRDAFVAAHADLVRRARRAEGCLDVAISADPVEPGRVNNMERWESWAHIEAWRAVAAAPETGIEFRSVQVQAYEVASVRPPF